MEPIRKSGFKPSDPGAHSDTSHHALAGVSVWSAAAPGVWRAGFQRRCVGLQGQVGGDQFARGEDEDSVTDPPGGPDARNLFPPTPSVCLCFSFMCPFKQPFSNLTKCSHFNAKAVTMETNKNRKTSECFPLTVKTAVSLHQLKCGRSSLWSRDRK